LGSLFLPPREESPDELLPLIGSGILPGKFMVGGPVVSLLTVGVLPNVGVPVGVGVGSGHIQISLYMHVPSLNPSEQHSSRVS